jgi:hypothetical protein
MTKHRHDSESDPQKQDTSIASHAPEGLHSVPGAVVAGASEQDESTTKQFKSKKNKRTGDEHKSKEQAEAKRLAKQRRKMIDKRLRKELKIDEKELNKLKKKLTEAGKAPQRGIETWFRLASRNLYTRRKIVDSKASILVTINALILSVVLGTVYQHLGDDPHLVYAVVPLVLTNLISIAFAIFASKPRLERGVFSEKDLLNRCVSLMTFDDFYAMSADEYVQAVDRVMQDRDLLYGTMKRDIYRLGVDLSRRYAHIQRAYSVFLFGIILATVMFGLCHVFYG